MRHGKRQIETKKRNNSMKIKTWSQAQKDFDIYYFTGKPCKHGHISKRQTVNGACYECNLLAQKRARHDKRTA